MIWFARFFNQEKLKNTQPCSTELKNQNFTGVLKTIVEEAIMAAAQWLIQLANSSIERTATSPTQTQDSSPQPNALEEIAPKIVALIDRFNEHSHSVGALADRLCLAEAALSANTAEDRALRQSKQILIDAIASLESRFAEMETLVQALEAAQQPAEEPVEEQPDRQTAALEARIAHLEKLLSRYSVVPKLIEHHHQTIAALQHRLAVLEFPHSHQHGNHQTSAANVN